MKTKHKFLLLIYLTLFSSFCSLSQETTKVKEIPNTSIGEKTGTALHAKVYKNDKNEIYKAIKAELKKKEGGIKVKGGILKASSVVFPEVSKDTIEVYARVDKLNKEESELFVLFMNKEKSISSEDVSAFVATKSFVFQIANDLSKAF